MPGKREWQHFLGEGFHRSQYRDLEQYLRRRGVDKVVPIHELLRQGTDWQRRNLPPFAMPPRRAWSGIVPTLRLLQYELVPAIGRVEVVSGFRTKEYNRKAGGSPGSRHLYFQAVDVVPRSNISRRVLHARLKRIRWEKGRRLRMGLGLYGRKRFHIDTYRYRSW